MLTARLWPAVLVLPLTVGVLTGPLAPARAGEQVAILDCARMTPPPALDGRLDDDAWARVPVTAIPWLFLSDPPVPAASRSEFRLGYDDQCVYLGATFHRDTDAPLKVNHRGQDDPDLWMDDSTEIYFDPRSEGLFYKLIVNSAGVFADLRQTEAGLDYVWSASGMRLGTQVTDQAWGVELALPWAALGGKPAAEAMWGFEILNFSGPTYASWTPGASHSTPAKFGYVTFGGGPLGVLRTLVDALRVSKGDEWTLVTPQGLLQFNAPRPALQAALASASRQISQAGFEARVVADAKLRSALLARLAPLEASLHRAQKALQGHPQAEAIPPLLAELEAVTREASNVEYAARLAGVLAGH